MSFEAIERRKSSIGAFQYAPPAILPEAPRRINGLGQKKNLSAGSCAYCQALFQEIATRRGLSFLVRLDDLIGETKVVCHDDYLAFLFCLLCLLIIPSTTVCPLSHCLLLVSILYAADKNILLN